jgi:hypothetical protein
MIKILRFAGLGCGNKNNFSSHAEKSETWYGNRIYSEDVSNNARFSIPARDGFRERLVA